MRSKIALALMMIVALAGSLVTAAKPNPRPEAGQDYLKKISLGTQVKLACQAGSGGDVASVLKVTNNTTSTVPSDTMVYFSTDIGPIKWRITSPIYPGVTKNFDGPAGDPSTCQAWFFQK